MKRGEIWLCDLGDTPVGHEAAYPRPCLVVSDDRLAGADLAIVAAITSSARGYRTHVEIEGVLPVTSYVQCEQLRTISGKRLLRRLGQLDPLQMLTIEATVRRLLRL